MTPQGFVILGMSNPTSLSLGAWIICGFLKSFCNTSVKDRPYRSPSFPKTFLPHDVRPMRPQGKMQSEGMKEYTKVVM